jgi:hypothetical protein
MPTPKRYPSTIDEHKQAVDAAKAKLIAACAIKIDEDVDPAAPIYEWRRQQISVAVSEFWQAKKRQHEMFQAIRRMFEEMEA